MTAISLTREALAALNPCDLDQRLTLFGRRKSLTARQALAAGVSISTLLRFAGRMGLKVQCATFAIRCAEAVAHLNADPRVAAAIEAAKACLARPTNELREDAFDAGDAAADAACFTVSCDAADAACFAAAAAADAIYTPPYAAPAWASGELVAMSAAAAAAAAAAGIDFDPASLFLEIFG